MKIRKKRNKNQRAFDNLQLNVACQYIKMCVLIRDTFWECLVKVQHFRFMFEMLYLHRLCQFYMKILEKHNKLIRYIHSMVFFIIYQKRVKKTIYLITFCSCDKTSVFCNNILFIIHHELCVVFEFYGLFEH